MTEVQERACRLCKHFFIDGEGWEYPQYDFANCHKRSSMMYLKSFPFHNTKCKTFERKTND